MRNKNIPKLISNERILWIDGLKGISSIFIILHHFILAFYPAMYFGNIVPSHLFGIDYKLSDSPIMFIVGGHFLICIFFLLSGIVLSVQSKKARTHKDLILTIIKRYIKLSIPLFLVTLIVFIMLNNNIFSNLFAAEISHSIWLKSFYLSVPDFISVFTSSFFGVWILGSDTFSTAFWMLNLLFFGSILTTITRYLLSNNVFGKHLIYSILIIISILTNNLLLNFVFGMIITDLIQTNKIKNNLTISYLFIFIGALLGGYPYGVIPTNFYRYIIFFPDNLLNINIIHTLGAFFLILGIASNSRIREFFSSIPKYIVGNNSYIIYLIHIPVLFSYSCFFTYTLWSYNIDYNIIQLLNLISTICLIVFVSQLINLILAPIIKYILSVSSIEIDK